MSSEIGPGTPLLCVKGTDNSNFVHKLTSGALYICEGITPFDLSIPEGLATSTCYNCGSTSHPYLAIKGKSKKNCPARFRPLNDGDTSLVSSETEIKEPELVRV